MKWFTRAWQTGQLSDHEYDLCYQEATLISPDWQKTDLMRGNQQVEILYGELDRCNNNRFEHRMLLWPESAGFLGVQFASANVVVVRFVDATAEVLYPT